ALVAWVEQGKAPDAIVATARGKGSNLPNPEVPASWSPTRTRLLCAYPQVARYDGKGDPEKAASFNCVAP
ncbi:Tannase and feruloyl esterase, partial [Formivibrio citricus]